MRTAATIMIAATIMLAACDNTPDATKGEIAATDAMSKDEVKAAVDKVKLKPGQWEGRFTVQDIDLSNMPGAPAGMEEQMKRMMSHASVTYCVTPEEAANPGADMFSGQDNKNCKFADFAATGGTVKGRVSCKGDGGSVMNAAMSGSYAPDSYTMDMDMKMEGGPQAMAMKARSEGKWIGAECTAEQ
ncbi:hypothetical protein J3E64_000654 [Sphingobium sp. OAS761]|uniref:DUF3617 domain-containing protein n=1 Tax=Sphingobium sp. OAS761 TaxID=2817901 RepID=UPI00209E7E34|nr:DUF3617 domain-containing protein [Sphingobium sp. OAS761]MCP1468983.1 hypothetical protein [Sphingobium sp. OAS761]